MRMNRATRSGKLTAAAGFMMLDATLCLGIAVADATAAADTMVFMINPLRDVGAGGAEAKGRTAGPSLSLRRIDGLSTALIERAFSELPSGVRDADKFVA